MQKIINLACVSFISAMLFGCASNKVEQTSSVPEIEPVTLKSAAALEKNKQFLPALKQYSQLIGTVSTRADLYSAMRGKARCLREIGRPKLALSALSPINVEPENDLDCIQLAMAGELLLQMRKYKEAESSLEVALDGVRFKEKKHAKWTAVASANLGNAYLRNGKLLQSKIMYKKAEKLFEHLQQPEMQEKCRKTCLALEQIQTKE